MLFIRNELPEDYLSVHRVNSLAFGREGEAELVDALREAVSPSLSLVAVSDGQVVGHIFFSPVTVESDEASFTAMGLAPMAVLPEHQNRGVGSRLVREGLQACFEAGHHIVFVLGHPNFYPRFGFAQARAKGFSCEYEVPDEVFMVAELKPGALDGRAGLVKYSPEFGRV